MSLCSCQRLPSKNTTDVPVVCDLPDAAFQNVIGHLASADIARLRLVSTSLCTRLTAAAPSINLRIPDASPSTLLSTNASSSDRSSSSTVLGQHLASWREATRQFTHASAVRVLLEGRSLTEQDWGAIAAELAARGNVKSLHLLSATSSDADGHTASKARRHASAQTAVHTLLPLLQQLPGLQELLVDGPDYGQLAADLTALLEGRVVRPAAGVHTDASPKAGAAGAAGAGEAPSPGGKQLLKLSLHLHKPTYATYTLPDLCAALKALPLAFPRLTHLTLTLPNISVGQEVLLHPHGLLHSEQEAAAVAAAAAAVSGLRQLQHVSLQVPDIWGGGGRYLQQPVSTAALQRAVRAAAAAATPSGAAAHLPVPALQHMDALGSWLLQQLEGLAALELHTFSGRCDMVWRRHGGFSLAPSRHSHMRTTGEASSTSLPTSFQITPPSSVTLKYHHSQQLKAALQAAAAGTTGAAASCSNSTPATAATPRAVTEAEPAGTHTTTIDPLLLADIAGVAARYSTLPVQQLLLLLSSLHATILPEQLHSIPTLLQALPALQHFQLAVLSISSTHPDLTAVIAAAAHGQQLTSLAVTPGSGCRLPSPHTFAPLTQATNTRSAPHLRSLKISGSFRKHSSGQDGTHGPSQQQEQHRACPWSGLQDLSSLEQLTICAQGSRPLLHLSSLPSRLQEFTAAGLELLSAGSPATAAAAAGSVGQPGRLQGCASSQACSSSSCMHAHMRMARPNLHFINCVLDGRAVAVA